MVNKACGLVQSFQKDKTGATAIEYGLLAAVIGIALIVSADHLGKTLVAQYECTAGMLDYAELPALNGIDYRILYPHCIDTLRK